MQTSSSSMNIKRSNNLVEIHEIKYHNYSHYFLKKKFKSNKKILYFNYGKCKFKIKQQQKVSYN